MNGILPLSQDRSYSNLKLKILHVLPSPHLGGAEVMCLNLCAEHRKKGHDCRVFFFKEGQSAERARELEIPVGICSGFSEEQSRRARWRTAEQGLLLQINEYQPDIIHSHVPITNLITHRATAKSKTPWLATMHGSWKQFGFSPETVRKPWKKPFLMARHAIGDFWTTRSAAKIVAISDYVRREMIKICIKNSRIRCIFDGFPTKTAQKPQKEARRQLNLPENRIIVGSLGYLAPVKGFDLLVEAAGLLKTEFPELLVLIGGRDVLGDTAVRTELEKLIRRKNLEQTVQIFDIKDSPTDFLATLDLYVVASRSEGFSLSLVEAMMNGKPSVVTSAGGCAEAARPGMESLVFRSGNFRSLADRIADLLKDTNLQEKFGEASRRRAQEDLSLERCAEAYEELYFEILEKTRESSFIK